MLKRVTMREVAAQAGVHVTTVSLALRNHASLPSATRQRLQALAARMGYRPDPMLSALVHYRNNPGLRPASPLIIYLNPWKDRKSWRKEHAHYGFYEAAKQRAEELGFAFDHCWLHEPGMTTRRWNQVLRARNVGGVILGSSSGGRGHLRLDWNQCCWVKLDPYYLWPPVHLVANNQMHCAQLAVRLARKHGYKRIGLALRKRDNEAVGRGWSAGYLAEMAELPTRYQVPLCLGAQWNEETFWKWFQRYRPEVVLSFHVRILDWFRKRGVRVPEEVGFVDLDLATADGSRAGIYENHDIAGRTAVDILGRLMLGNETGLPPHPVTTQVNGRGVSGSTLLPRWRGKR